VKILRKIIYIPVNKIFFGDLLMENNIEETLSNIEVFCRVLIKKIFEEEESHLKPSLIKNLVRRKYTIEVYEDQLKMGPLVDVFEDEKYIKILVQYLCRDKEVSFCMNEGCTEIWIGREQKIKLPIKHLDVSKAVIKYNNQTLEILIQK
jgi:HSP20 family molecular chaperone IbpA